MTIVDGVVILLFVLLAQMPIRIFWHAFTEWLGKRNNKRGSK